MQPSGDSAEQCFANETVKRPLPPSPFPPGQEWEICRARYGECTPQFRTSVPPITGERLQETTRQWGSQASGGTDGGRRAEWKQFAPDACHVGGGGGRGLHTSIEEKATALLRRVWPRLMLGPGTHSLHQWQLFRRTIPASLAPLTRVPSQ